MTTTLDKASTYTLVAFNGRPIRKATRVTLGDGRVVTFEGFVPKHAAIAQAREALRRDPGIDEGRRRPAPYRCALCSGSGWTDHGRCEPCAGSGAITR